jgi:excisionase family DNA binding protein
MPNDIVTTAELAERIRLSRERVRDLARTGKIPSLQTGRGGKRLYIVGEVLQALRGTAGPAAPGQAASPAGPGQ